MKNSWPLIFSTSGGMGKAASVAYKHLASLLRTKRDQPYSVTMVWLRYRLSFSLLRLAVMCLQGSHSRQGYILHHSTTHFDLIFHEGCVPQLSQPFGSILPVFIIYLFYLSILTLCFYLVTFVLYSLYIYFLKLWYVPTTSSTVPESVVPAMLDT